MGVGWVTVGGEIMTDTGTGTKTGTLTEDAQ